jgi:hypothetical protein
MGKDIEISLSCKLINESNPYNYISFKQSGYLTSYLPKRNLSCHFQTLVDEDPKTTKEKPTKASKDKKVKRRKKKEPKAMKGSKSLPAHPPYF